MINSQSKEYICKESNIKNFDSVFTIKSNSIWNYDTSSTNTLLFEEKV